MITELGAVGAQVFKETYSKKNMWITVFVFFFTQCET